MYWSNCKFLHLFFRHLNDVNRYCINCGVKASIDFDNDLKKAYTLLEEKLNLFNKRRVAIRRDGHCLPKPVFRGCKSKDILPQYLTYKALLSAATTSIQENWSGYCHVVTEDKESTLENLRLYSENKAYMLPSIMVDLVLYSLSNILIYTYIHKYTFKYTL